MGRFDSLMSESLIEWLLLQELSGSCRSMIVHLLKVAVKTFSNAVCRNGAPIPLGPTGVCKRAFHERFAHSEDGSGLPKRWPI